MRNVSRKFETYREATARSVIRVSSSSIAAMNAGSVPKGDPLPVAKIAAIQAVKNTPQLIPYCHTVPIEHVEVRFEIEGNQIICDVTVRTVYKTGVEMEAMAGAMVAALNIYDILKMIDDDMEVLEVKLLSKTGGKSDFKKAAPWEFAILVASDRVSRGIREDRSGLKLQELLENRGGTIAETAIVPDSIEAIQSKVQGWIDRGIQLVVTTGGTGLSPTDCTPEALEPLIKQRLGGVEIQIHQYGQRRTPYAFLSRLICGVNSKTVILGLPGSPKAVEDAINASFPALTHVFDIIRGADHT